MKPTKRFPPGVPLALTAESTPMEQRWRALSEYLRSLNHCIAGGVPSPHAPTHKGGADSVAGSSDPSAITLGDHTSDPGTPGLGMAPINHIHDDSALEGLAGLGDTVVTLENTVGTAVVSDRKVRRLLEKVLIASIVLEELISQLVEDVERISLEGVHRSTALTYISGVGVAGVDNTAQTVLLRTLPANTLSQVGDRIRFRTYFAATAEAAAVGSTSLNGVTTANTSVSGTNLALTECWIHYLDESHANIIENASGALGALSAVNVSGFHWTADQPLLFTQDAVNNQHLVIYALIVDVFPQGVR